MRNGALQGQIERHFFFRDHFGSLFLHHRALISWFVLNKHNLIQSHCSHPMRQSAKERLQPLNEKNSENLAPSTQTLTAHTVSTQPHHHPVFIQILNLKIDATSSTYFGQKLIAHMLLVAIVYANATAAATALLLLLNPHTNRSHLIASY